MEKLNSTEMVAFDIGKNVYEVLKKAHRRFGDKESFLEFLAMQNGSKDIITDGFVVEALADGNIDNAIMAYEALKKINKDFSEERENNLVSLKLSKADQLLNTKEKKHPCLIDSYRAKLAFEIYDEFGKKKEILAKKIESIIEEKYGFEVKDISVLCQAANVKFDKLPEETQKSIIQNYERYLSEDHGFSGYDIDKIKTANNLLGENVAKLFSKDIDKYKGELLKITDNNAPMHRESKDWIKEKFDEIKSIYDILIEQLPEKIPIEKMDSRRQEIYNIITTENIEKGTTLWRKKPKYMTLKDKAKEVLKLSESLKEDNSPIYMNKT